MKNSLQLFLVLMALLPALAACTACDCPRPAPTSTTVITPPGHNMVVEPAD